MSMNGAAEVNQSIAPSTYLAYLPSPYQGDEFLGRFLRIFEDVLGPIELTVDEIASYFDPLLTPEELLPWLASWVGVELDERWPVARRRALVARAAELYRWRGTRRGLREHLRIYTGYDPLIVENFSGMRLGQDAALGRNTRLGQPSDHWLAITVLANEDEVDEATLRRIIEAEKPAHVGYAIEIQAPNQEMRD
jgi:phage tail-like protein